MSTSILISVIKSLKCRDIKFVILRTINYILIMSCEAESISKGCFPHIGKHKKVKASDYFQDAGRIFINERLEAYRTILHELQTRVEDLQTQLNTKMFEDLISFTGTCHNKLTASSHVSEGSEVPTAVLVTGVNTPDHSIMFSKLEELFKNQGTLVARALLKDCNNLSTLVRSIVQQLTDAPLDYDDDDEIEDKSFEDGPVKLKLSAHKRKAVTMMTLVKWYKKNCLVKRRSPKSPKKKARLSNSTNNAYSSPVIVIMLEEMENMTPLVLQDLVSLCSSYLQHLPLVFVFGVATTLSAIHLILPASVVSLLCMEKFQAPPASLYLTKIMDEIILTPNFPFKLGSKVFHLLLDIFLYHDFSVMNFVSNLQYCMLEHFTNNPLSLLCCDANGIENKVMKLSHSQTGQLRKTPAFISSIENVPSEKRAELLSDDSKTKKYIISSLRDLHSYHHTFFAFLRCFNSVTKDLPGRPMGKQIRETYSICLSSNLHESQAFQQALHLIELMSAENIRELLVNFNEKLQEAQIKSNEIDEVHESLHGFIYRLDHLDEEKQDMEDEDQKVKVLPQRAKLHELKKSLQILSSRRKKSPYEKLREEIIEALTILAKQFLINPNTLPLSESVYFTDVSVIRDRLRAAPRCSIQKALTLPSEYLNCACCKSESDDILPSMPDICIAYKLHLECGTLVNLYDWLQAFCTVCSTREPKHGDVSSRKKSKSVKHVEKEEEETPGTPSVELRARFIRSVSELQFLGFIKSTQKKTDHVTRLTW